jgi:hypothetical protein
VRETSRTLGETGNWGSARFWRRLATSTSCPRSASTLAIDRVVEVVPPRPYALSRR